MTISLESLPNEIILVLFGYLDGISLLHAFYSLNARFDCLLYKQFRAYCFDFPLISKATFDMICQQHLPFLAGRITDLILVNDTDTPGQINLFFNYMPSIGHFIRLQSLELHNLRSYQILIKIVDNLHHLCNLTHLYLYSCDCRNDKVDFQSIVNNIWSLPTLTHCYFDVCLNEETNFCVPTKISTSLKNLYISHYTLKYRQIHQLMDFTTRLKRLSISIDSDSNEDYQPSPLPTLIHLKISACHIFDTSKMISLLRNIPNLHHLDVRVSPNPIDGYQWEQLIRNYLPKLKIFKLSMKGKLSISQNIQERADELINSFRSPFWIDEHQWFVRCAIYNRTIHLQTLSDTYDNFENTFPDWWKSTYPDDDREKFFNTMEIICHETFFDQPIPSFIRLENIGFLYLKLPITDQLWSVVSTFKQLNILEVSSYDDSAQTQLQVLFDRATKLDCLDISQKLSLPLQTSLFKYTTTSIRQLDLHKYNYHFNEEECLALSRSPLGRHCRVLSIQVKNRESIVILVQSMINLQALHVNCANESSSEDNNQARDGNTAKKEEVIQWLNDRLPSTCFISKYSDSITCIRIWIK